jgi:hypothetical protein
MVLPTPKADGRWPPIKFCMRPRDTYFQVSTLSTDGQLDDLDQLRLSRDVVDSTGCW